MTSINLQIASFSYKKNRCIINQCRFVWEYTMAKGFHFGRVRTRHYTVQYPKLCANSFKPLLELPLGKYCLTSQSSNTPIELKQTSQGIRFVSFEHANGELQLGLITCERSASKKLYITCPYCQIKRQHLYQCKDTLRPVSSQPFLLTCDCFMFS